MLRKAAVVVALVALGACKDKINEAPAPTATAEHAQKPTKEMGVRPGDDVRSLAAKVAESAVVASSSAPATSSSAPVAAAASASGAASASPAVKSAPRATSASSNGDVPKATNGVLSVAVADKILPGGRKPLVKVLDAGAEPKSDLAYALEKGSKQGLEIGMEMTMAIAASGRALPEMHVPKMTMLMDIATGDKDDAGDWKIDAKLTKVGLSPKGTEEQQIAAQMKEQVDSLAGLSMNYFVSKRGQVRDVKLELPPGFPKEAQQMLSGLNQSFESMVAPLPSEAVGQGGKWQVITRIQAGGADLLQFATYTLKSRSGNAATLDVTLTQLAASDVINAPGMPADAKARLKSFSSSGSGTTVVDLVSVAPTSGTMNMKTSMDLATEQAGQKDASSVTTNMKVTFTRPKS